MTSGPGEAQGVEVASSSRVRRACEGKRSDGLHFCSSLFPHACRRRSKDPPRIFGPLDKVDRHWTFWAFEKGQRIFRAPAATAETTLPPFEHLQTFATYHARQWEKYERV